MKKIHFCLALISLFLMSDANSQPESGEAKTTVPWLSLGSPDTAELGQIHRPDGTIIATISGGWNAEQLELRVLVDDADHIAPPNANSLWAADSLEVGIDTAGDATGNLPRDTTGPIGKDDFKFIFGLLGSGPAVNTLAAHTKPDLDALLACTRISRTSEGQTLYELSLPWSLLNITGGTRPTIGLDMKVNDLNSGQSEKTNNHWGNALRGGFRADLLKSFSLGTPDTSFAAIDWDDTFSWDGQSPLTVRVGLRTEQPLPIKLILDGTPSQIIVPGGTGFQFKEISLPAQPHDAKISAQLPDQASVTALQTVAATLYRNLQDRLAELLDRPNQHPIFIRHLNSLASLTTTDWGRVQLLKISDPRRAIASVGYYQDLLTGLYADTGDWAAYLDGRRSLVIAYVSPHDQSTQYYLFCLPRDWDESHAYPLFFELHGAGNDHPMAAPANRLAATAKRQDGFGYESPKVYAEIERSGYWVQPFGRGNLSYDGIARIDILEAYDHVHDLVSIDPDRRYLYGFSMGGKGTFTLGARTPDRWAAACSIAAATRDGEPENPITANWTQLPYKIMCGEEDRFITSYHQILTALAKYDIHPEARSIPNLGHNYTGELQKEKIDWLTSHVRQRPDTFTFATDDNLTNTCWGLTLILPNGPSSLARATYRSEGQTLHIDTEGTNRIELDPSEPDGLGLTGEIRVIWNGIESYKGPAKQLTLE